MAGRFLDLPWLLLLDSASAGSGLPDARALGRYSFPLGGPHRRRAEQGEGGPGTRGRDLARSGRRRAGRGARVAAGDADRDHTGTATVPGRRRRLHRLRLRSGAGARSPDAVRRPRAARRRARPLRLGDRVGPPVRCRLADLAGRRRSAGAWCWTASPRRRIGNRRAPARSRAVAAQHRRTRLRLRCRDGHRAPLHLHPPWIPRRRGEGPRVHRRGRHLPGQPVPALPGAATGAAFRAVPPAAPPEPRALRGLSRLRRL